MVTGNPVITAVTLARTEQRPIRSRTGAEYRIFLARPADGSDFSDCPVVYVLDANAVFATVVETLTMQSMRSAVTGVRSATIVGIGYPTDLPLAPERRTLDYTPTVSRARLPPRPDGTPWPAIGGADQFLDFIEEDLIPMLAAEFGIATGRRILFGHSFGGLLTLYALFSRPHLFESCIAASPSIWFGEKAIVEHEAAFAASLRAIPRSIRLMIGVGGLEQTSSEHERTHSSHRADWIRQNRMMDNAAEMAARLERLAPFGLEVNYLKLEDETHVSVIPALISRGLRFALSTSDSRTA